jgi:RNA polymerase sigma factor (sigma-70 family)
MPEDMSVIDEYFYRLIRFARKLGYSLGGDYSASDAVMSAFGSFLRAREAGRYNEEGEENILRILFTTVRNKIVKKIRERATIKRGGGRVRNESELPDEIDWGQIIISQEPTPELAAEVADDCQELFDMLPDQTLRDVAQWKLEGYTNEEIAEKLGRVRRTVERKLERIREIWLKSSDDDAVQTDIVQ